MLELFAEPPEGKGKEAYSIVPKMVCIHTSKHSRGDIYISQVKTSLNPTRALLTLGYISARLAVKRPGMPRGNVLGYELLKRIRFLDISGECPVRDGVVEAKALLPQLRITYVDGDTPARPQEGLYEFAIGSSFKCNPKVYGRWLVFLAGYWAYIRKGVQQ